MRRKFQIKYVPVTALAVLLGICGGYALNAPAPSDAGNISSQPIQSSYYKTVDMNSKNEVIEPFCSQNAPLTDLALILGICGNHGQNTPEQANAYSEPGRPIQSSPSKRIITISQSHVSEISCIQNIPRIAEERFPLIDEGLDSLDWNDDAGLVLQDA